MLVFAESSETGKKEIVNLSSSSVTNELGRQRRDAKGGCFAKLRIREDIGEYVAQLQLHMTLQSRNLVPTLTKVADSREQFLHETQAEIEKLVSRQEI